MRVNETGTLEFTQPWGKFQPGQVFQGKVERIFRVRSGAVLAVLDCGDRKVTVPVSKYITWQPERR